MEGGGSSSGKDLYQRNKSVQKFFIPLVPEELVDANLKVPTTVVKTFGDRIPHIIFWNLPNGDKFEWRYCNIGHSFCGAVKVLREYNVKTYGLLTFEFISRTDFLVSIFDTSGVEIEYPGSGKFFPYEAETATYLSYRSAVNAVMVDSINANTLERCCKKGWEEKLYILVTNPSVEVKEGEQVVLNQNRDPVSYWFDECGIYLSSKHRVWTVYVRKVDKIRVFREGWKEFVAEAGVEKGDLLIMERDGNPFHYQIGVCKGYDNLGKTLVPGAYKPRKFIRFVNEGMLRTGETFIPITLWHKYGYALEEVVYLTGPGGKWFRVQYSRAGKKLYAMQQFLVEYELKNPYILVFRLEDARTVSVQMFGKNRVDCYNN